MKKCIESRGHKAYKTLNDYPGEPKDFFIVQMDKSTCQSNNRADGIFGYPGKPTKATAEILGEIAEEYGVFIGVIVQPTHRYDLNACDALYHSIVKRRQRQYPFPLCQDHIRRDYALAVSEMSTDRVIQRSFWRAHRRDAKGDIDESLLPQDLLDWYVDSSDEEDTVDEHDSDVEIAPSEHTW